MCDDAPAARRVAAVPDGSCCSDASRPTSVDDLLAFSVSVLEYLSDAAYYGEPFDMTEDQM